MESVSSDKTAGCVPFILSMAAVAALIVAKDFAFARDVELGGGVSVGYQFDDRKYDQADQTQGEQQSDVTASDSINKDERYSRMQLAPLITLTSLAERDQVELRYSPIFWWDVENSYNDVDHDLRASFARFLAKNWQVKFADRYLMTDDRFSVDITADKKKTDDNVETSDTATTSESTVSLSDINNRRRYWTNDLSFNSDYQYASDSTFGLGYQYTILNNTDSNDLYEDYDRHEVSSQLGYRLDPVWKATVFGSYVRGLVDEPPLQSPTDGENETIESDFKEFRAGTILTEQYLENNMHSLYYSFYEVDYDDEQLNTSFIHNLALGWQWDIARKTVLGVRAGPTYVKTEGADGDWDYNGQLSLNYGFERGSLSCSVERVIEVLNFTGAREDNGLREAWNSEVKVDYQLAESVIGELYARYRYEDQDVTVNSSQDEVATDDGNPVTGVDVLNRKRYSTGANLEYSFYKWYKLVFSYDYIHQDSEFVDDSYDEHRVGLFLSYETDFFKW